MGSSFFSGLCDAGLHAVAQDVAFELRVLRFSAIEEKTRNGI